MNKADSLGDLSEIMGEDYGHGISMCTATMMPQYLIYLRLTKFLGFPSQRLSIACSNTHAPVYHLARLNWVSVSSVSLPSPTGFQAEEGDPNIKPKPAAGPTEDASKRAPGVLGISFPPPKQFLTKLVVQAMPLADVPKGVDPFSMYALPFTSLRKLPPVSPPHPPPPSSLMVPRWNTPPMLKDAITRHDSLLLWCDRHNLSPHLSSRARRVHIG